LASGMRELIRQATDGEDVYHRDIFPQCFLILDSWQELGLREVILAEEERVDGHITGNF
jgi:hypothetical protein